MSITLGEKKAYVERKVELSPEQSEEFWPVYERYQEDLKPIDEEYILFVWSRIEGAGILDSDKAETTTKECLEIERKNLELNEPYTGQFSKILPPGKLLIYYQLETRPETFTNSKLEERIPLLE